MYKNKTNIITIHNKGDISKELSMHNQAKPLCIMINQRNGTPNPIKRKAYSTRTRKKTKNGFLELIKLY